MKTFADWWHDKRLKANRQLAESAWNGAMEECVLFIRELQEEVLALREHIKMGSQVVGVHCDEPFTCEGQP